MDFPWWVIKENLSPWILLQALLNFVYIAFLAVELKRKLDEALAENQQLKAQVAEWRSEAERLYCVAKLLKTRLVELRGVEERMDEAVNDARRDGFVLGAIEGYDLGAWGEETVKRDAEAEANSRWPKVNK